MRCRGQCEHSITIIVNFHFSQFCLLFPLIHMIVSFTVQRCFIESLCICIPIENSLYLYIERWLQTHSYIYFVEPCVSFLFFNGISFKVAKFSQKTQSGSRCIEPGSKNVLSSGPFSPRTITPFLFNNSPGGSHYINFNWLPF